EQDPGVADLRLGRFLALRAAHLAQVNLKLPRPVPDGRPMFGVVVEDSKAEGIDVPSRGLLPVGDHHGRGDRANRHLRPGRRGTGSITAPGPTVGSRPRLGPTFGAIVLRSSGARESESSRPMGGQPSPSSVSWNER